MANSEETKNCMLEQEKVIGVPTYQYFYNQAEQEKMQERERKRFQ
jgi:thiol:disulfide interchange protein